MEKVANPDDVFCFQQRLAPVGIEDKGIVKSGMNSAFCFWPMEDNAKEHSLDRIAELNYLTGSVYSVRNMLFFHALKSPTASDPMRIHFRQFEHAITKAVLRYVNMLKGLGVRGPYFVGLSLLNVRWFKMKHGEWDGTEWLITDHDSPNIQTVTQTMPADADTSTPETVEAFLIPSYEQVWRAFHLRRPKFRPDDSWEIPTT